MKQFDGESDIELELELKRKLRPVLPPDGFVDGVMKRVVGERRVRRVRTWLAATVLLGMLSGAAAVEKRDYERRQEELAGRQFNLAMQVTGRTLSRVQEQISQVGLKSSEVTQ